MECKLLFSFIDAAYVNAIKTALIAEGYDVRAEEGWHCWGLYLEPGNHHRRKQRRSSVIADRLNSGPFTKQKV